MICMVNMFKIFRCVLNPPTIHQFELLVHHLNSTLPTLC